MAAYFEAFGQTVWADRAFDRALAARLDNPQPIMVSTLMSRLMNATFLKAAVASAEDVGRRHLWLRRARELTGLCLEATTWSPGPGGGT